MRIPSGTTDQVIFFEAKDIGNPDVDLTGLSEFTVYRARNEGAPVLMTDPGITELSAANMPGVYSLFLDEDMTIGAGNLTEEMIFSITHAGMKPVRRTIELFDPTAGFTFDEAGNVHANIQAGILTATLEASALVDIGQAVVDNTTFLKLFSNAIEGSVNDTSPAANDFNGDSSLSGANNFYNGAVLVFTSGALKGIGRRITTYLGSTKTFQFSNPFPAIPANGDLFMIVGRIDG